MSAVTPFSPSVSQKVFGTFFISPGSVAPLAIQPYICEALKPGCPAIKKDEATGCAVIDDTMCNGCGLCQQLCPFGAIELIPNTK